MVPVGGRDQNLGENLNAQVLKLLTERPQTTDELAANVHHNQAGYQPADILAALTKLELAGMVYRVGSHWYHR